MKQLYGCSERSQICHQDAVIVICVVHLKLHTPSMPGSGPLKPAFMQSTTKRTGVLSLGKNVSSIRVKNRLDIFNIPLVTMPVRKGL